MSRDKEEAHALTNRLRMASQLRALCLALGRARPVAEPKPRSASDQSPVTSDQ